MRVVPLFETLEDLENAPETMATLLEIPWYAERIRQQSPNSALTYDPSIHPGGYDMEDTESI